MRRRAITSGFAVRIYGQVTLQRLSSERKCFFGKLTQPGAPWFIERMSIPWRGRIVAIGTCCYLQAGLLAWGSTSVQAACHASSSGVHPAPLIGSGLAVLMKRYKVPGISVAVIDDFRIAAAKGYGVTRAGGRVPVNSNTLFQAGSVSKTLTAAGALALVQSGKLSLDGNVNDRLRMWHVPENGYTHKEKVTLRRILSHTSGLTVHGFDGYQRSSPVPTLLQILDGEPPATNVPVRVDSAPGTEWRYSGGAFEVAQQLMTEVTAVPFAALMKQLVLGPVGMAHSTFEQPLPAAWRSAAAAGTRPDGTRVTGDWEVIPQQAAAGLWTTPSDLARFAIDIALSRRGKSNRVLSERMTEAMLSPQVDSVGEVALGDETHPDRMGLGFFLGDPSRPDLFGHIGDDPGFTAMLFMFANAGNGLVVTGNSDNALFVGNFIATRLAKTCDWQNYVRPQRFQAGGVPRA